LARTNAQLTVIAEALDAARIPYRIRRDGGIGAAVRRWWTDRRHLALRVALDELIGDLGPTTRPAEADGASRSESEPDDPVEVVPVTMSRAEAASRSEQIELARAFLAQRPDAQVAQFLPWMVAAGGAEEDYDVVELATFHAAKGLEWPVVVIAGIEEGLVPMSGTFGVERDEERRLLYVAMTRARRHLVVSWATSRQGATRRPSPWIAHLGAAQDPGAAIPPARIRPTPPAPPLIEHLRVWRSSVTAGSAIDSRAVLSDDALDAIDRFRPGSIEELASIDSVGPLKAARFGESVLRALAASLGDEGVELVEVDGDEQTFGLGAQHVTVTQGRLGEDLAAGLGDDPTIEP
jgi:DNA helicase-2/ATP-dependent DNA helicase PcrA